MGPFLRSLYNVTTENESDERVSTFQPTLNTTTMGSTVNEIHRANFIEIPDEMADEIPVK